MPPQKVLLLVPPGAEALEVAAFTDVFGWHQAVGSAGFHLVTCSAAREVPLSFGHTLLAQALLRETSAQDYAALALPGGFGRYGYFQHACSEPYLALLRAFAAAGKPLAAVCTAAIALGEAGLLVSRHATTYALEPGWAAQLQKQGAIYTGEPLTIDGPLITSQNPASAVPVALTLLERLAGPKERAFIQRQMGF